MGTAAGEIDINFELVDSDDDLKLANAYDESMLIYGALSNVGLHHEDSPGTSKQLTSIQPRQHEFLEGFDIEAGRMWIYPTNYPVRDYQMSIVRKGLYNNTLVSLPTGLGKTFIAAVIMYNFYRWYPQGKVVFMAPTKPLVAQQIEACFNIMGIPQIHMSEMTGSMQPSERKLQWKRKRVFFLTPQIMSNDLIRGICDAKQIKCLVVDEAHKALGNHAYAVVVREMIKVNRQFRILALSATPGGDVKTVQQIITNLLISNVEIRTEESLDIQPYVHRRNVELIVVPLSKELENMKNEFCKILKIYVERLASKKVLFTTNPDTLSKFMLLKEREKFRQDPPTNLPRSEFGKVEGDFALAVSLYHAYELLLLHGMRSFYHFLKGITEGEKSQPRARSELQRNNVFCQLISQLEADFETPNQNNDANNSSSRSGSPSMTSKVVSHPKMQKVLEIVLDHFLTYQGNHNSESKKANVGTRVMVFAQYRDTVNEITDMLNQHQPLIKAMSFVGQACTRTKGLTQKLQLQVMNRFRQGGYNTLIATCVGEEGLDIGEVDLIVCYDAHKSPIRLVQRMGRTGRQREGRIIMVVTKGKEEKIYNQGQFNKRTINKTISKGSGVYVLYAQNPRMIPKGIEPDCHQMFIAPKEFQVANNRRNVHTDSTSNFLRKSKGDSPYLTADELHSWNDEYKVPPEETHNFARSPAMLILAESVHQTPHSGRHLSLNNWLPWQDTLQTAYLVSHTKHCNLLIDTIQHIHLQAQFADTDNAYDLEMAAFLNKSYVLKPGEKDSPLKAANLFTIKARAPSKSSDNQPSRRPSAMMKKNSIDAIPHDLELDDDFSSKVINRNRMLKLPSADDGRFPMPGISPTTKELNASLYSPMEVSFADPQRDILSEVEMQPVGNGESDSFFTVPEDFDSLPFFQMPPSSPFFRMSNSNVSDVERAFKIRTPPPSPPEDCATFESWLVNLACQERESATSPTCNKNQNRIPKSIVPKYVVRNDNREKLSEDVVCEPSISRTVVKEASIQKSVSISDFSRTYLKESLYGTTQLMNYLENSAYLGDKFCNSLRHGYSNEIRQKDVYEKTIGFEEKNISEPKVLLAVPQCPEERTDTHHQNSDQLIHFRLDDEDEEEVQVIVCSGSDLSDSDIIPPSPECDSKRKSQSRTKMENLSVKCQNAPIYLNGQHVSPILDSRTVNSNSTSLLRIKRNAVSTPIHTPCKEAKEHYTDSTSPAFEMMRSDMKRSGRKLNLCISEDEESVNGLPRRKKLKAQKLQSHSPGRQFLEEEAVDDDESSEDEEKSLSQMAVDAYGGSFIDDRELLTQLDMSPTSRMALYLRTVRSPHPNPGAFMIKKTLATRLLPEESSLQSEEISYNMSDMEDSEYEHDSFCVDNDVVEYVSSGELRQTPSSSSTSSTSNKPQKNIAPNRKRILAFNDSFTSEDELTPKETVAEPKSSNSEPGPSVVECFQKTVPQKMTDVTKVVEVNLSIPTASAHSSSSSTIERPIDIYAEIVSRQGAKPTSHILPIKATSSQNPYIPVILVDSREVAAAPNAISDLRLRHHCEVKVVQLGSCDYIVSSRMAVERKCYSAIANNTLRRQLLQRLRGMLSIYEKSCLVIEKDYVRPNEQPVKELHTRYYANTLACLANSPVKLFFSESQEHTADILFDLSQNEHQKGFQIDVPLDFEFEKTPALRFYLSMPKISYVTALNFCSKFKSINEFMNSSIDDLIVKGGITTSKANFIYKYLCHQLTPK